MKPIKKSRNQREGRYIGWRVTGDRYALNRQCRKFGHERGGNKGVWSLKGWARVCKGGCSVNSGGFA